MERKKDLNYFIESIYDVNIDTAIRYLIGLYCICDNTYTNWSKRERMLIIYQLCCMKNNQDIWENLKLLLDEKNRIRIKDYTWIDGYGSLLDRDSNLDSNDRINDNLSDTSKILLRYKMREYEKISNETKDLLTEIFREFGGYDSITLRYMIDEITKEFIKYSKRPNSNNINDSMKQFLQNENNLKNIKDNKIIQFVNNYDFDIKNEKTSFSFDKVFNEFRDKFISLSFEEQKELLRKINMVNQEEEKLEEEKSEGIPKVKKRIIKVRRNKNKNI